MADLSEQWKFPFTIVILVLMFGILITDRIGTDSVMLTVLTVFYLADIIDLKEALAGFNSRGILTVLVLFVVAEGLNKTGALSWYVGKLLGRPRTPSEAQLRLLIPIATLSGFINDTPLVVLTMPIVIQWARNINIPSRYLLMPLSFAAMLGGVCTIIGTSTNLVIVGLLQDKYPNDERFQNINLFALGQYGVPVTLAGIAYMVFFTPYLLVRHNHTILGDPEEDFLLRARLTPWSPAVGRSIQRSGLRDTGGIYLVRVKRSATGNIHHAVSPEFVLQRGDILYFTGLVENFGNFCSEHGLEVVTNEIVIESEHDYLLGRQQTLTSKSDSHGKEVVPMGYNVEAASLQLGRTLDSVIGASPSQRWHAIYQIEDSIRETDHGVTSTWQGDRIIVTKDESLVVVAIDTADRSELLLDLSKCLAGLHLELHHTEAAVRYGRSLSIWRCESANLNNDFLAEIWSVIHATLMADKGVEAVKQRGQRVLRAQVLDGRLAGATAGELKFRETYKAAIVAVQREGKGVTPESSSLANFRFAEGDVVVLQVSDDSPLLLCPPNNFYDADSRPNGLAAKFRTNFRHGEANSARHVAEAGPAIQAVWRDLRVIQAESDGGAIREFLAAVIVVESELVGKTAASAGIERLPDLMLVSIERPVAIVKSGTDVGTFKTIPISDPLQVGDVLWFTGTSSSIGDLRKVPGFVCSQAEEVAKVGGEIFDRRLVQAVVSRQGLLVGKTIKEVRFRTLYGAAVIAVHREGKRVHDHPGNVKLQAGDVLLLEAGPSFMSSKVQRDKSFALIAEVVGSAPPRMRMLIPALILTVGAYACYVAKLSELIACAMVSAILMVLLGILSETEARDSIQWNIYLTIAAAFGIGSALVNSGVAKAFAKCLVEFGKSIEIGEAGILGAVYLSTVLISQCVANNAAAALMFPIAMEAASTTGIDRMLMSLNVMLAASAAFMTPFSYQTNLMVMGPGGYNALDFLIFGTPLQIVLLLITTFGLVTPLWLSWLTGFVMLISAATIRVIFDRRRVRQKRTTTNTMAWSQVATNETTHQKWTQYSTVPL